MTELRSARVERATAETAFAVDLTLDGRGDGRTSQPASASSITC